MTVYSNGTLVINKVKASDEGFYSCVGIPEDTSKPSQTYAAELNIACEY